MRDLFSFKRELFRITRGAAGCIAMLQQALGPSRMEAGPVPFAGKNGTAIGLSVALLFFALKNTHGKTGPEPCIQKLL